jgi:hypothetical protein
MVAPLAGCDPFEQIEDQGIDGGIDCGAHGFFFLFASDYCRT